MKKSYLMTLVWSRTVEVELPDGVTVEDIEDATPKNVDASVCAACREAADEFRWKDLIITNLEEV